MKSVLFDLDGTLLDTLDDLMISVNYTMEKLGFPLHSRKEIRAFVGNGAANLILQSLPENKKDLQEEALAIFKEHYAAHSDDNTRPYPEVDRLLSNLKKKGYQIAIISNKPDFAVKTLAKKYFPLADLANGEIAGIPRKPAPDGVNLVLEQFGSEKHETLYVGDSDVDVITAKNAEIPCIAVTWGFRDRDVLEKAGAEVFADSCEELERAIERIFNH